MKCFQEVQWSVRVAGPWHSWWPWPLPSRPRTGRAWGAWKARSPTTRAPRWPERRSSSTRDGYGDGTTLKTDKKGRWAIAGIAAATWNADIEAPGFAPKKISINLPSEASRLAPVEVKLDKAQAAGPPPEVLQALEKGEAAYKEGRFADARAEFEKLLALRPDLATTIHQRIGFAYIQEKEYAKGLDHLQKVLDADPSNAVIRGVMAQAALEGGMLDRGMELLKGIDESTVKSPDLFFNIGVNFVNANKPEEAIAYFTKAVTVDPAYADGYFRRGLAYMGVGQDGGGEGGPEQADRAPADGPPGRPGEEGARADQVAGAYRARGQRDRQAHAQHVDDHQDGGQPRIERPARGGRERHHDEVHHQVDDDAVEQARDDGPASERGHPPARQRRRRPRRRTRSRSAAGTRGRRWPGLP